MTQLADYQWKNENEATAGGWEYTDVLNDDGSVMTEGHHFFGLGRGRTTRISKDSRYLRGTDRYRRRYPHHYRQRRRYPDTSGDGVTRYRRSRGNRGDARNSDSERYRTGSDIAR